ncbi:hypothetical protein PVAND_010655 [Polypedilum vanderplanki]|uniref:Uncharacterized protein n=1 Tax=Polypedilum vanderplanki TaxID=319348 RepID=A0A9J6CI02_POLVA|nr:hypothetical protein PVAND_010655 [Polypedilum vanderplanki]
MNRVPRTQSSNIYQQSHISSDVERTLNFTPRRSRISRNNVQSSSEMLSSTVGQSSSSSLTATATVPSIPSLQSTLNFASENYRTARVARLAARARIAEQAGQSTSRTVTTANAAAGSYHHQPVPTRLSRRRNAIDSPAVPPQQSHIPRPVRAVRMNPTVITIDDSGSESFDSQSTSPFVAPMPRRFVVSRDDLDTVGPISRFTRHARRQYQNGDL